MTIIPISYPLVSIHDGEPRTTSLVMADGTENEHASVIKLVRTYQADLEEFGPLGFEIDVVNRPQGGGSEREVAILNQEQATLLLTYMRNTEIVRRFKKALVKAFFEMARQLLTPSLNPANLSRLQILTMAIEAEQKVQELSCKLEEMTPKADALDRIATRSEGSFCLTDAAKALQVSPKWLMAWLSQHQWIYRRTGNKNWIGYQDRLQAGLLEHKVTSVQRTDGTEKVCEQVLVTAKGLAKLAKLLNASIVAVA